jgi:hypothetical protein
VHRLLFSLFFPVVLSAQDTDPYQAARALQEAAAQQQRESVRAQAPGQAGQPHVFSPCPS